MVSVGIRELKEKLSSYVLKVKHGETIVVTDHGKEVAILGPISSERAVAMQLVREGKAKWVGGKPRATRMSKSKASQSPTRSLRIVGEPLSRYKQFPENFPERGTFRESPSWIDEASLVSVCRIAFPEAMSAVERRFRSGDLSQDDRDRTVGRIAGDWAISSRSISTNRRPDNSPSGTDYGLWMRSNWQRQVSSRAEKERSRSLQFI